MKEASGEASGLPHCSPPQPAPQPAPADPSELRDCLGKATKKLGSSITGKTRGEEEEGQLSWTSLRSDLKPLCREKMTADQETYTKGLRHPVRIEIKANV